MGVGKSEKASSSSNNLQLPRENSPLISKPHHFSSQSKTFANVFIAIVGAGVLGLPYTFRKTGWVMGSLMLFTVALLTYHCMMLLIYTRRRLESHLGFSKINSFGDLGFAVCGPAGRFAVDAMIVLSQAGFCISYLIFIANSLAFIFNLSTDNISTKIWGFSAKSIYIWGCFPFQLGLNAIPTLTHLAPLSIFADVVDLGAMGIVMVESATSIAPWQHVCYYPIPNFQIHRLHHLSHTPKISSSPQALNYQAKTNLHHFLNNDLFPLSATTSSCSKEQENNNNNTSYPHQNHSFLEQSCSSNQTQKTQKIEDKRDKEDKVVLRNMWWADLKAAVGQRINLEGISCGVGVITKDRHLVVPHVALPDIRYIDWADLKRRGFQGVVFDKDNTLTVPYSLALWGPLKSSVEECKSVFGNNIAVFSNSAGLHEYDPDGRKARALEFKIGIKVVRHRVKKPAGSAEEIETHFGCDSSRLIMVGDRPFTDIVYGNRNGFLTILTNPLSIAEEPFIVRQVRKLEVALVKRWSKKGFQPTNHQLLPDSLECVKDQPSL